MATHVRCYKFDCPFIHHGTCMRYMVHIGEDTRCIEYQEIMYEKTSAPAQLKSDLEYFDEDAAEGMAALEILSESDIIKIKNLPKCKANCKYCSDRCGFPWCEKHEICVDISKTRCIYYEEVR